MLIRQNLRDFSAVKTFLRFHLPGYGGEHFPGLQITDAGSAVHPDGDIHFLPVRPVGEQPEGMIIIHKETVLGAHIQIDKSPLVSVLAISDTTSMGRR